MSAAAVGNPGFIAWKVMSDIANEFTTKINWIKEDALAFHDISNFVVRAAQFATHYFGNLFDLAKGDGMLRGVAGVVDGVAFLVDLNYFIQGEWKNNSIWCTLESAAFLAVDTVGTALWVGSMGFPGFAQLASWAGSSAAFSIFGAACSISANTVLGGLLVVPFGFQMVRGIDDAVKAENQQQRIYGSIVATRAFVEVVAAVTACAAAIFGVATAALPAVLALGALAALIAVGGFLYKQSNLDLIQKQDQQSPATV